MLHPIYAALLRRPDLAADHLLAYADLLQLQTQALRQAVIGRSLAWLVILGCGALALFALGAALLENRRRPWQAYAQLRAQLDADLAALRSLELP